MQPRSLLAEPSQRKWHLTNQQFGQLDSESNSSRLKTMRCWCYAEFRYRCYAFPFSKFSPYLWQGKRYYYCNSQDETKCVPSELCCFYDFSHPNVTMSFNVIGRNFPLSKKFPLQKRDTFSVGSHYTFCAIGLHCALSSLVQRSPLGRSTEEKQLAKEAARKSTPATGGLKKPHRSTTDYCLLMILLVNYIVSDWLAAC